ncbi:MAG: hypothetical protein DRI91_02950 [Aquificota bacterium]|nr:MAG: hypothetical protein DRI91_02950 [Aquificota bacterium]
MLVVKEKRNRVQGLKDLLKGLLEKDVVKALLVPMRIPSGESFAHVLTREAALVDDAWPIPPVMTVQGARVVSKLTRKGPVDKPTAVVLRPCELRAMRELIKLNQVKPEGLLTISFDCQGAYPLKDYIEGDRGRLEELFQKSLGAQELPEARPLCQVCYHFTGELADIEVGFVGASEDEYYLVANSPEGEEALKTLGYQGGGDLKEREEALKEMKEARRQKRRTYFTEEFGSQISGPDALLSTLHDCTNCHNCMRVCPICFCRECFFDSDALKVSPDNYLGRARKKGALRLLPDTLLFHMGRMNHMSLSCVSCGVCEDACPNGVPVSRLFAMVGDRTRAIFDYEPGRDLEESIPFLDYREEELQEWEAPYTQSTTHCPSSS